MTLKISVFWDVMPCSPLKVNRHFVAKIRLHFQGQWIKYQALKTSVGGSIAPLFLTSVLYEAELPASRPTRFEPGTQSPLSFNRKKIGFYGTVIFKLGYAYPRWYAKTSQGVRENILTSIKTKDRNRLNLEPALILEFTKIRPRIEVLARQKQAQSSH
jgi:hypothetical protein